MDRGRKLQASGIDEVRTRFEQWRQTRLGKARIPDELWLAAVEVARRHGCNRTAAALRLEAANSESKCWQQVLSRKNLHDQHFWN
jgi:hypothetical protein